MAEANPDGAEAFDKIIRAYYEAVEAGQAVEAEEFIRRHPDHESMLRSFFSDLRVLSDLPDLFAMDRTIDLGNARTAAPRGPGDFAGGRVTYIGQYRLLGEIARGGMGVVYKAKQEKLGRLVALKMILSGPLASSAEVDRFRHEAQSAARLQHPNIVSVHEIGQHRGHYFFTMDYIESDSLADRLREGSLAAEESAKLVTTIARAMHYAHQQGVLHRDLKPANILVDLSGQPHITDFGLAKAQADVDHETFQEMTRTGQILGTPSYMSPEQAAAKSDLVGVRSDVYSLGAILYACLVGRAPFVGESPVETLHQVLHADAPRVRLLNVRVPRDLETICHKCLQKESHLRYATAAELADDLDRYLGGRPIAARPVGLASHAWKWCKRRPDVTTLLVALAATLLIGVTTVVFLWRTAETRRWQAEKSEHDAKQTLYDSWLREARATRVARQSGYRGDVWRLLREAGDLENVAHDHERVRREAIACLGDFVGLTPLSIDGPVLKDARGVSVFLDEHHLAVADTKGDVFVRDLRSGKETSRLFRVGLSVVAMESIAGGRGLLLVDQQRTECWQRSERGSWIQTWTKESGFPSLYMDLALADNLAAIIQKNRIALVDAEDGRTVRHFSAGDYSFQYPEMGFLTTAISPDGRLIAAADHPHAVFVWDVASGDLLKRLVATGTGIPNLAFTSDSSRLILGSDTGVVSYRCDDLSQWTAFQTEPVRSLSVSPDNSHLLIQSDAGAVQLWNLRSQRLVAQLANDGSGKLGCTGFSPLGSRFLASGAGLIRVWDFGGTPEKRVLRGHFDPVRCLAFHPSAPLLASGSHDRTIRFWDTRSESEISKIQMGERIQAIAFSPDGIHFAAATRKMLRVWQIDKQGGRTVVLSMNFQLPTLQDLCFSPDGQWMAVCGGRGPRIWKRVPGKEGTPSTFRLHKQFNSHSKSIEFDSTGRYLAMTRPNYRSWIDLHARDWTLTERHATEIAGDLSASDAPGRFTIITSNGRLQDWVLPADQLVPNEPPARTLHSSIVATSISGGLVAAKSASSRLELFDSSSHHSIGALADEGSSINAICWDADATKLAVGLADGSVSLWDLQAIDSLLGEAGLAKALRFFPDAPEWRAVGATAESSAKTAERRKQTWEKADKWTLDQGRVAQLLELWGIEPAESLSGTKSTFEGQATDLLARQMYVAGGAIEANGAFVTKVAEADFEDLNQELQSRGYRLSTICPYRVGNSAHLAAGWVPGPEPVICDLDLTEEQLLAKHSEVVGQHYRLLEVGGYLRGAALEDRFYALWIEDRSYQAEQVIFPNSSRQQLDQRFSKMFFDHEPVLRQSWFDAAGKWRYIEVWEKFPQLWLYSWRVFDSDVDGLRTTVAQDGYDRLPATYVKIAKARTSGEIRCSGVWRADAKDRLARYCYALHPDSVRSLGRAMLKAGFQPTSLSVTSTEDDDQLAAALWQRHDPDAKRLHPGMMLRGWPMVRGSCRLEGERLYHTSNSGRVFSQPMGTFTKSSWSNHHHLLWIGSPLDRHLDLAFEITRKGVYEVKVRLTTAFDFGVVQLELDDQGASQPIDLYRAGTEEDAATMEINLGEFELDAHAHRLRVYLVGAHKDSKPAHGFGIDYVQFTKRDSKRRDDAP